MLAPMVVLRQSCHQFETGLQVARPQGIKSNAFPHCCADYAKISKSKR